MPLAPASFCKQATMGNMSVFQLAAQVRLLLMDVDGGLTDAKLYNLPDANGNMIETKGFDAQDGIALQWLSWMAIQTGVISGRIPPPTQPTATQDTLTHTLPWHI